MDTKNKELNQLKKDSLQQKRGSTFLEYAVLLALFIMICFFMFLGSNAPFCIYDS